MNTGGTYTFREDTVAVGERALAFIEDSIKNGVLTIDNVIEFLEKPTKWIDEFDEWADNVG